MKITADILKQSLISYFRYNRQMICGTEIFMYCSIADVVAVSKNGTIYEVETKISKEDFIRDFKKQKHDVINMARNYFYFCVPSELKEFALDYLKDYPNYGLFVFNTDHFENILNKYPNELVVFENRVTIEKKARKYKIEPRWKIYLRNISELWTVKGKYILEHIGE